MFFGAALPCQSHILYPSYSVRSPQHNRCPEKKTPLVGAQPSPCCSVAGHLVGKMIIHCPFAHY